MNLSHLIGGIILALTLFLLSALPALAAKGTSQELFQHYRAWLLAATVTVALAVPFAIYVVRLNRRLRESIASQEKELTILNQVEEQLQFINTILSTQQEVAPDGVLVVDQEGMMISFNQRFVDMWDIPADVVESRSDEQALQSVLDKLADPEEFLTRVKYLNAHHDEKSRTNIELKDGRTFDRYSAPISGPEGKYYGRFWHFCDITDRKQAEEALRESEEKMRSVLETATDIILNVDRNGKILFVNRPMHGTAIEKLVGTDVYAHISPKDHDTMRNAIERVFRTGEPDSYEFVANPEGQDVNYWYTSRIGPLKRDGQVVAATIVTTDVTELKRSEEVLQEANRTLEEMNQKLKANQSYLIQSEKMASIGQIAAGVAHEINNPVGFVKSNLGTLTGYIGTFKDLFQHYELLIEAVRSANEDEQSTELGEVDRIQEKEDLSYVMGDIDGLLSESIEGTNRIQDIVKNLKSFARMDDSQTKVADINEGIEATLKIVWNELKYKCTVHKDLKPLPHIRCNPGQLNQVFMNILVNAAQSIPEKGDISIETEATDSHIIIKFTDTGAGIPPENISKLFEPFFTTKNVGKGTGLGLSISHSIIQKHKGVIEVASEVGKGTTFTIRLPIDGVNDE